jgi:dolichol kinase
MLAYPIRVIVWAYSHRKPSKSPPLSIPMEYDLAPLLYPPSITLLVSLLLAVDNEALILPNVVLSICSLPRLLIPFAHSEELINPLHWTLSSIPIYMSISAPFFTNQEKPALSTEVALLLYPLHQTLIVVLNYLTTTSLLEAELQLLSIALINLLFFAHSPQAQILRILLWVGGVSILVFCGEVIRWGIALARVPKLRFRRSALLPKRSFAQSLFKMLRDSLSIRRIKRDVFLTSLDDEFSSASMDSSDDMVLSPLRKQKRVRTFTVGTGTEGEANELDRRKSVESTPKISPLRERRHTLPTQTMAARGPITHTPSGRRKRSASTTVRSFFKLTQAQATAKKWLYALYTYATMVAIILVPVRWCIGRFALDGEEPIGWALGYFLGDLPRFRFAVVSSNLERWICLPPRHDEATNPTCQLGWVQHLRLAEFGVANTHLLLSAYCLLVISFGLVVVIKLDPKFEVDTRRKVFHFMMVAMLLPASYIDPAFVALALSIILATFLMLDLLRASQLPPLSKPLAAFLAPYVDGRDHKGPVVISHIFLLIGCAIPLWLTLGTLPHTGSGYLRGWEVPTREASMVAGVVCVGLGDAAASLIGRRYGHRKWIWGGGKSIEGSAAFTAAVFVGLLASTAWLRIGRWQISEDQYAPWPTTVRNAGLCASVASLTEAALTGGNDNVVVPVVLWTCVKSLGV